MRCVIPAQDLQQRLNETVCRYDDRAVRVKYSGGNLLELYTLTGQAITTIKSDDPLLDISGVPTGYVQLAPSCVVWTARRPARMFKQGLTQEALVVKFLSESKARQFMFSIYSKGFEDMVNNKYPSLEDARKLLKIKEHPDATTTEIAISRDVALRYNHKMQITSVFFRGKEVGFIIKDEMTVITPTDDEGWIISKHLSAFTWEVK